MRREAFPNFECCEAEWDRGWDVGKGSVVAAEVGQACQWSVREAKTIVGGERTGKGGSRQQSIQLQAADQIERSQVGHQRQEIPHCPQTMPGPSRSNSASNDSESLRVPPLVRRSVGEGRSLQVDRDRDEPPQVRLSQLPPVASDKRERTQLPVLWPRVEIEERVVIACSELDTE